MDAIDEVVIHPRKAAPLNSSDYILIDTSAAIFKRQPLSTHTLQQLETNVGIHAISGKI